VILSKPCTILITGCFMALNFEKRHSCNSNKSYLCLMTDSMLRFELNSMPKDLRDEVELFIEFIKTKYQKGPNNPHKIREFGLLNGKIKLALDFDEPVEDFEES